MYLRSGSANNWWLRSANPTNSTNFHYINNNGNVNNNNASNSNGACFGFCIISQVRQSNLFLDEISAFAKGACDLSERINKNSDMVDWTLLALQANGENLFNSQPITQSEIASINRLYGVITIIIL